eukprot:CAMPEP_0115843202 /NCGR_PEP_ID=MMETSP0287-20121206/8192_1 /TAXON_ID=412157 /ORGANISM="Chrysochromulina rotalis, Strain UIO044" /LENGTH=100 /DNA_ID=CAMNT_0003296891 /DNA_START=312 /DNA_END=612 /DNA_ORIENTATION=+
MPSGRKRTALLCALALVRSPPPVFQIVLAASTAAVALQAAILPAAFPYANTCPPGARCIRLLSALSTRYVCSGASNAQLAWAILVPKRATGQPSHGPGLA